jgi:uncharacterized protein DUF5995
MADLRDCRVLRAGAATSVVEVIGRLTEIRDSTREVAPECGIAEFSDLYLTITQRIWDHIEEGDLFADNKYLARLDVTFGNRYLDALRAWANGQPTPRAWRVLFEARTDGEIMAIQLAGAGVNAHINFDLAVATVDTGREMGDAGLDTRREDYARVNDVFAERMDALLRNVFAAQAVAGQHPESERLSAIGRLMTRIVAAARQFAWEDAEELWPLPRRSKAWDAKEAHMDAVAYLVGRGLLVDLPG